MTGDSRWIAVTQDLTFPLLVSEMPKMGLIRPKIEMVCKLSSTPDQCNCYATRTDCTVKVIETYFETVLNAMIKFLTLPTSTPYNKLNSALEQVIAINKYPLLLENFEMKLNLDADILILNSTFQEKVASWSSTGGLKASNRKMRNAFRKKIRVGIIEDPPFIIKTEEGYTGFCIEILKELQRLLDFDYELVIPEDGYYGIIEVDGRWNGLVGQLARAETDMILAALSMTAERAEVIDFVTPYFDQTGIGILGRKPEKQKSLFKFMEVLKPEVWWGVLGGIVATGLCLWILDRYSPYSNRNNRQSYSQSCREFNLKESFWFVLTSFTPQGGGEVPKSLSGRVLVAGYWLFVVLILATFTANLAALLTVERMQSYVRSLEEMAQRVDFNFTVIESSSSKQYFINMAEAEEELYHAWKNITLNSGRENGKFRVWDYPIKEQYKNILKIIERSQPVSKVQEGVQRVKKNTNGHFALLTDSPKVRYLVNEDCDLTMIGEPFAEHPYGIAVTKGSTLLEELNEKVMQLQRQRFFEDRISKYWNSTKRRICDALDNSDSLTVYDLGGVFIITLVGLVIALLALSLEVWHFSKRNKSRIQAASVTSSKKENILTVFRTEAWTTSTYVKDEK
ncbi:ionotropic receptor 25a-like [Tachypleus tridentatus]|uniref:ionotropic receptor 25a-like n=1 Tax=Tachypleus tridentatus TaxID=6853 RepID=UPI003FD1E460